MAYTDQYTLATDATFQQRVQIAAVEAAINLYSDPASTHEKRAYCTKILNSPESYAARFAYAVAADNTITSESSDSVVFSRLAGVFESLAGG